MVPGATMMLPDIAYQPLTTSLSTTTVSGTCFSSSPCIASSNSVTVTATKGMGQYASYSWEYVSGDVTIAPDTQMASTTTFSATVPCTIGGNTIQAVWRCIVTDKWGKTAASGNVTIDLTNLEDTTCI